MESSKKTTWIAGTVLLAVAILSLAWFVLIAPVVDETTTAATDTQVAEDRNAALRDQLVTLKEQYANLATYQAELTTLETQIPATAGTSDLQREIESLAAAAGTTIVDLQISTPVEVLPPTPVEAAPAADAAAAAPASEGTAATAAPDSGSTATSADASSTAPAEAAPVEAAPVIPGFVAIPVSVTALGNPVGALSFLGALQEQSSRLFLVTGLDGTGQGAEDASGGRPATADGDIELVISGYVYVLKDLTAPAPVEDPAAPPAQLPTAPPALSGT